MKKKRILAILMAAVMSVTSVLPAFAADQVFTEDGTAQITATAEITSSYKVKLPALVALAKDTTEGTEKNSYKMDYTVGAAGNIDSDKFVNVEPDITDFVLKDASGRRPVTPELTTEKVSWSAEDLDAVDEDTFVDSTSAVSAVIPKAGKYSGTIVYNFTLSETEAENTHKPASNEPVNVLTPKGSSVEISYDPSFYSQVTVNGDKVDDGQKVIIKEGDIIRIYSSRGPGDWINAQGTIIGKKTSVTCVAPASVDSGKLILYYTDSYNDDNTVINTYTIYGQGACRNWEFSGRMT